MQHFKNQSTFSAFHYSFCVSDLQRAKDFYLDDLGLKKGRETDTWFDANFFGHELSIHQGKPIQTENCGLVDGIKVPMPHFGICLEYSDWLEFANKIEAINDIDIVIKPTSRFVGLPGEQHTVFFRDPFGNAIEVKGFKNPEKLFV